MENPEWFYPNSPTERIVVAMVKWNGPSPPKEVAQRNHEALTNKSKTAGCLKGYYYSPGAFAQPGFLCHGGEVFPPCQHFPNCPMLTRLRK